MASNRKLISIHPLNPKIKKKIDALALLGSDFSDMFNSANFVQVGLSCFFGLGFVLFGGCVRKRFGKV